MLNLLIIREQIKQLVNKYDKFVTKGLKFLLALSFLAVVSLNTGFNTTLKNPIGIIVLSVICAFIPLNINFLLFLIIILVHLYALSSEIALAALLIMIAMYLLYFRFTLKDCLVVILLPILFFIKIPYVIPLVMGLMGTPIAIISVTFGTMIYFILDYAGNSATLITNMSSGSGVTKMTMLFNAIFSNKLFLLTFISFSLVILIVYFVRRMSINHAPLVSVIAGGVSNIVILLLGYLVFNLSGQLSIAFVIIGSMISIVIAYIFQSVLLPADYSRAEYTQFEDDEYYYYVKAVPKINVTTPEVNVKRINVQRSRKKR